jgi:hypothetical protein
MDYKVTATQIMSWEPCDRYPEKRVKELFSGRKYLTALDVLELDIPSEDKLWAVLRKEMIPEKTLHEFACQVAENALLKERERGREPHEASWKAIEVKRAWLEGKATDEELAAARAAARDAAWDAARAAARDAARAAAWDAAWAAARAAARDAAWDAAWAAAWAAAWDAAWDAAWAAAWAAAWDEQVEILKKYLSD